MKISIFNLPCSDPNNSTDPYLGEMKWNPFDWSKENYLGFGTHLIERNGLNLERYRVWDEIFSARNTTRHFDGSFLKNIDAKTAEIIFS